MSYQQLHAENLPAVIGNMGHLVIDGYEVSKNWDLTKKDWNVGILSLNHQEISRAHRRDHRTGRNRVDSVGASLVEADSKYRADHWYGMRH